MDNLNKIPVLITGGGAPGAAGIIRCARQSNRYTLIAGDVRPVTVGRFLADDYVTLPLPTAENFIGTVLGLCSEKNIRIILPLVTKELPVFAQHQAMLASKGIRVIVSPVEALQIANNKGGLYDHFRGQDFIPDYYRCSTWPGLLKAVNALDYPVNPVCFKPCLSNGSRGFRILDESKDRFDLLFNHKPDSSYSTLKDLEGVLSENEFPELLVTRYLAGAEFSVDALCVNGNAMAILPRKRNRMVGGISVEGEFVEEQNLINYTRLIISRLGLHGPVGLQFRAGENGRFYLLEINPRVQGTISASLGAGINLVELALEFACNGSLPQELPSIRWGTKFIRYWDEVFFYET